MAGTPSDFREALAEGQDHVAKATLEALTHLHHTLRERDDLTSEDHLAALLHAASVFAVESLRIVVRQLGRGSAADHDDAVREMLMRVCLEGSSSVRSIS